MIVGGGVSGRPNWRGDAKQALGNQAKVRELQGGVEQGAKSRNTTPDLPAAEPENATQRLVCIHCG